MTSSLILSWSTGCRLNDIKFGFCHGQQGVDSMTSSLDSVMVKQGVDSMLTSSLDSVIESTGCRLNDVKL